MGVCASLPTAFDGRGVGTVRDPSILARERSRKDATRPAKPATGLAGLAARPLPQAPPLADAKLSLDHE